DRCRIVIAERQRCISMANCAESKEKLIREKLNGAHVISFYSSWTLRIPREYRSSGHRVASELHSSTRRRYAVLARTAVWLLGYSKTFELTNAARCADGNTAIATLHHRHR